jgi:hypothetical protein
MVSMVELSEAFLIVILPLSMSTASLKVRIMLAFSETPVALSEGEEEDNKGAAVSPAAKLSDVLLLIPAYELPEASSKAVASILI